MSSGPLAGHRLGTDPVSSAAHRDLSVGGLTVTAVSDGVLVIGPKGIGSPQHPTGAYDELAARYGEPRLPLGCFVLRGEQNVLIDTGIGPVDNGGRGTMVGGNLLSQLDRAGLRPGDIDIVALSHMHGDHVGTIGAFDTGLPVFPDARVYLGRADWAYFIEEDAAAAGVAPHVREALAELDRRGLLVLMDDDIEIVTGLRRIAAPGHTPGHSVYLVENGDERLYLVGDAMHCPQQLAHPDWAAPFDVSPPDARRVREQLALKAGEPGTIGLLGSHFPELLPIRS